MVPRRRADRSRMWRGIRQRPWSSGNRDRGLVVADNPPEGFPRVSPYLPEEDTDGALEFIVRAFGFTERYRMPGPGRADPGTRRIRPDHGSGPHIQRAVKGGDDRRDRRRDRLGARRGLGQALSHRAARFRMHQRRRSRHDATDVRRSHPAANAPRPPGIGARRIGLKPSDRAAASACGGA